MSSLPNPASRLSALPASALLSEEVESERGDKLGYIKDLMVDLQRGCVTYAVLSVGGLFGIGRKLFAVPWVALDRRGHVFVLHDQETFLRQPLDFDDIDTVPLESSVRDDVNTSRPSSSSSSNSSM